jgi:peptide/nickel transport system substrate-binding protein
MTRRMPGAVVLFTALALTLAACGSSAKSGAGKTPTSGGTPTSTFTGTVPNGGTLVVGAEQEPDCMDWIGACSGSAWGTWMAQVNTQPSAFVDIVKNGQVVEQPGPVLSGMPEFQATPVEKITYNINPAAKWSDNVPITCADFQYTAAQQQSGQDIYDPTGYVDASGKPDMTVTCPTPKTAVVTYKQGETFALWHQLFASAVGLFPSHLLVGKNRDAALKDGYAWSGGPWFAKWNKGQSIVLTPNPNYWGPKPHLDKVVFQFETDTAAEFQAFKSGQVQAIYPQPQIDVVDQIQQGLPGAHTQYQSQTATVEALWMNNGAFPFNSVAVRQAIGYAIDRVAIVKKLFGPLGVTAPANSLNPYVLKDYSDQNAFAFYHLDLSKVNTLMTGAGWTKGSDGIWAKDGKRASFSIATTAGNKRRELTEEIIQPQLKAAGFDMSIKNTSADNLFGKVIVNGTYQMALFGQSVTALTPGLCSVMCTQNIPTPANQYTGNNTTRTAIPANDKLLVQVDNNLDPKVQMEDAAKADDIMAQDDVSLPLDPLPDILIWSDKVVGPIVDNPIEGMFWNIDQWGLQK